MNSNETETKIKPVVFYTPEKYDYIQEGKCAFISGVSNHPELPGVSEIRTSTVIKVTADGFETLNTIYRKRNNLAD